MSEGGGNGTAERLDRFMARANAAYYARRDPFADFATAPEIAQVFGELLGAWAAVTWSAMGSPDPVRLCEVGPGRGTLMADALRLVRRVAPEFHAALDLHLVDTSPRLREIQAAALSGEQPRWHDAIDTLPSGPLILLGNEFLDALPIRQFVRVTEAWVERHVGANGFVQRSPDALPEGMGNDAPEGAVLEVNEVAERVVAGLATRLRRDGGVALFLDYGPARFGYGDTLQALRDGRPADPLAEPGQADLTAHVPFPRLRAVAEANGARVYGPVPQGAFLSALGLFPRTERLMRGQTPQRARVLLDAAHRLAAPERMGRLFKAMVLCHPDLPVPAGFEEGAGK